MNYYKGETWTAYRPGADTADGGRFASHFVIRDSNGNMAFLADNETAINQRSEELGIILEWKGISE